MLPRQSIGVWTVKNITRPSHYYYYYYYY